MSEWHRPEEVKERGLTVWFTGLSGAGKSTLCETIATRLCRDGTQVQVLDGDVIRRELWPDLGYSRADRDENVRRLCGVASLLTQNGIHVLVAAISPYREMRAIARQQLERFIEVYVNAPIEVCERRDPKGLYAKARKGELLGLTGVDDPYEAPLTPDVVCHSDLESIEACCDKLLAVLDIALCRSSRSSSTP